MWVGLNVITLRYPTYVNAQAVACGKMSTCTEKQYRLKFKGLVARLSQRLDAKNHESLRYVYCEQLRPCEPGETGILVALEELERHRIFSYDQPEKFAEILREVGREDCCEEVKIFIRK